MRPAAFEQQRREGPLETIDEIRRGEVARPGPQVRGIEAMRDRLEFPDGLDQGLGRLGTIEQACRSPDGGVGGIEDSFECAAGAEGDDGRAGGHRLDRDDAEVLDLREDDGAAAAVVVADDVVVKTVQAIIKSAKTGKIGDGKIFVLPIEEAVRIRTDERGEAAL